MTRKEEKHELFVLFSLHLKRAASNMKKKKIMQQKPLSLIKGSRR